MPAAEPSRLLILGGTTEAAALARAALARFGARLTVTSSLAGRTERPAPLPGQVRIGGFGGAEGLARHLREAGIDLLIDATHPFAARISVNARAACAAAGVPRLVLERPMWDRAAGDRWIEVDDAAGAAAALRRLTAGGGERRILLTVGLKELVAFAELPACWFLVRMIDPPARAVPLSRHAVVLGRGPFTETDEHALLVRHRIDAIVCRASGGAATAAKILAARALRLPVVMLRRPPVEPGPRATSVAATVDWIAERLDGTERRRAGEAGVR